MVKKICAICGEIFNDYNAQSYRHYCDKCRETITEENEDDDDIGWKTYY